MSIDDLDDLDDHVVRAGLVWFWDHDAQPCSMRTWARECQNRFRHESHVGNVQVVTAYLGMNDGNPLPPGHTPEAIYGTLVVKDNVDKMEFFSPTRRAALEVHDRVVANAAMDLAADIEDEL